MLVTFHTRNLIEVVSIVIHIICLSLLCNNSSRLVNSFLFLSYVIIKVFNTSSSVITSVVKEARFNLFDISSISRASNVLTLDRYFYQRKDTRYEQWYETERT